MHTDLVAKLKADFPILMHQGEDCSFTRFGLEVGVGWYPLVYEFFALCEDIQQRTGEAVGISQVKEQYGTLRIHARLPVLSDEQEIIETAFEALSKKTCDICGGVGALESNLDGVWCTRCAEHRNGGRLKPEGERAIVEQLLRYEREGIDTSFLCHIQAASSGKGDGQAVIEVCQLPERILSLKAKGIIEQSKVSEHIGSPEALRDIVRELGSHYEISGFSDASQEAIAVFDQL